MQSFRDFCQPTKVSGLDENNKTAWSKSSEKRQTRRTSRGVTRAANAADESNVGANI